MSSFATAASRNPEPPNGRQYQYPADPDGALNAEAPSLETQRFEAPPRFETAANGTQPIDEIARVERLISQLEARSMALVPYGYGRLPEVPSRKLNTGLLASVLVAIWLTSVILVIAYMRYVGHAPSTPERATTSTPFVITPEPEPQDQKVAASVDHLARMLVSSSQRMTELQVAVEKSNRDLQKIASKVNSEHPATAAPVDFGNEERSAGLPSAGIQQKLPKNWHKVLNVKPTDAAVPHKGADGLTDYWLVPRGTEAALSKVLPIGTSAEGVVVHNLEDGKDYTLTPAGEWRTSGPAPGGN
jgi:hypothetical protein